MRKYLAAGLLLLACSCNSTDQKVAGGYADSTTTEKGGSSGISLADEKVQNIYDGYIVLKNALVQTKYEDAKAAAATLKASLGAYKGCENTAVTADKIANAKDIVEQRKEFTALSSDVIALFKHSDLKSGSIYVQRCPMANNGEGGEWLASEKKIQNPYYGDEMMECGAVLEEIKSAKL